MYVRHSKSLRRFTFGIYQRVSIFGEIPILVEFVFLCLTDLI
jgi:hypothetical protein